jgi:NAD+ synthase (glutamine-hydrolysing)
MARTNGSRRPHGAAGVAGLNGADAPAAQETQASVRAARHEPTARTLRLALAQIDAAVGDLAGNTQRITAAMDAAAAAGAQIVCFPELALTGYPPEDLLLKPRFISDNLRALELLARHTADLPGLTAIAGFVDRDVDIFNAAAVLRDGCVAGIYHKHFLPNYGVYDEDRYFAAGSSAPCFLIDGVLVGVSICEDIWYPDGPATAQASAGAELLLNLSASPFHVGKQAGRERMLATRAADSGAIVAYVNLVGGQDELIFDGCSTIFDEEGELLARARAFALDLLLADLDVESVFRTRLHDPRRRKERGAAERALTPIAVSAAPAHLPAEAHDALPAATQPRLGPTGRIEPELPREAEAYQALVLGVRDYVGKNGFQDVVIGLSGGIDSALTATIAVDALGPEHVLGVSMPSRYSSAGSKGDAAALAANLGIHLVTLPIEEMFSAALATLAPTFAAAPGVSASAASLTEENLQARLRGNLLMALSNRYGSLVLTTGNKSEMAVGYATLYGDMAGGFAVLKDVFKTLVYELARWRNTQGERPVIPASTIEKAPSAELRPDQRDEDSLPPYRLLDPILRAYVEEDRDFDQIVALGFAPEVVRRTLALVDHSEYKRRQAPPGIKITTRAFGRDRRLPLTSAYRGQPAPFASASETAARAKR